MSLNQLRRHDDESPGNYRRHICSIFISSLSSFGFTLILFSQQSDRLPLYLFFPPIVPVLISLSQITLRRQGGSFVFLLTETGFSWAGPKVHIRVLLRSCSEFCRYQREGCWISLKTLPSTVVFQSPRLQRSLSQAGLSLSSSNRSCLPPWILIPIPFNHLKGGLYVKFRIFKGK